MASLSCERWLTWHSTKCHCRRCPTTLESTYTCTMTHRWCFYWIRLMFVFYLYFSLEYLEKLLWSVFLQSLIKPSRRPRLPDWRPLDPWNTRRLSSFFKKCNSVAQWALYAAPSLGSGPLLCSDRWTSPSPCQTAQKNRPAIWLTNLPLLSPLFLPHPLHLACQLLPFLLSPPAPLLLL